MDEVVAHVVVRNVIRCEGRHGDKVVPQVSRFAPPESMTKKAGAKPAKKKKPVTPKFDAATAVPSEATHAVARAQHEAQKALARSICAHTTAAPRRRLYPGAVARCESLRE